MQYIIPLYAPNTRPSWQIDNDSINMTNCWMIKLAHNSNSIIHDNQTTSFSNRNVRLRQQKQIVVSCLLHAFSIYERTATTCALRPANGLDKANGLSTASSKSSLPKTQSAVAESDWAYSNQRTYTQTQFVSMPLLNSFLSVASDWAAFCRSVLLVKFAVICRSNVAARRILGAENCCVQPTLSPH